MKQGWKIKKLGNVCNILNGGTPSTKVPGYWGGKHLWITPKDMGKINSIYVDETERKITDEGLRNSSAKLLPINSIIVSTRAPIGHLAINRKLISTNQGCKGIIPSDEIDTLYLFNFLKYSVKLLNDLGRGTTFKELSGSKLSSIDIPIPPLPEQKRIVAKLDECFEAIDKASANVKRNLQNAQELFQSQLNQIFSQKGEGWVEKKLKDIGETQTGSTPSTKDKNNYGDLISFVKPAHFKDDGSIDAEGSMLSEKGLRYARLFKENSILMVCIGATIGKTGFTEVPVTSNQQINALTPKGNYEPKFFYYALLTRSFFDKVIHSSSQATLPIINKSKWENLTVAFPLKRNEQKSIVALLEKLKSKTQSLESHYQQELEALAELKKSILQKAFNGELTKT